MRILIHLLSTTFLLTVGVGASAEEAYLTATGEEVSSLDLFKDCDACPEMIVLPLGHFHMGSSVEEANAANSRFFVHYNVDPAKQEAKIRESFVKLNIDPDQPGEGLRQYYVSENYVLEEDPQYHANQFLHELPRHQVVIDMSIAIGRNEVTREEWAVCVAEGGCEKGQKDIPRDEYNDCERNTDCEPTPDSRVRFRLPNGPHPTHPRSPMTGITYHEMTEYTSWLNRKIGANVYRIPTEAEWEYAARAGTTTPFAQGNALTLDQANFMIFRLDYIDGEAVFDYNLGSARELLPVDNLDAANGWGLRHMSGNASELTSTCGEGPHRSFTSSSQYLVSDSDRSNCRRSLKGGTYTGNMELARPARRIDMPSDRWSPTQGFRVARDLTSDFDLDN